MYILLAVVFQKAKAILICAVDKCYTYIDYTIIFFIPLHLAYKIIQSEHYV